MVFVAPVVPLQGVFHGEHLNHVLAVVVVRVLMPFHVGLGVVVLALPAPVVHLTPQRRPAIVLSATKAHQCFDFWQECIEPAEDTSINSDASYGHAFTFPLAHCLGVHRYNLQEQIILPVFCG